MLTYKMLSQAFVLFFISLTVPQNVLTSPIKVPLRWDKSQLNVIKNNSVILHCHGDLQSHSDEIKVDHVLDGRVVPVYTGSQINPDLRDKFFSNSDKKEDEISSLKIFITGVQEENAGEYLCYSSSTPHLTSSFTLNVQSSIEIIGLRHRAASYIKDGGLAMKRGEQNCIECMVSMKGKCEAPQMRVLMDMKNDVTHFFTYRFEIVEKIKEGLPEVFSNGYLTYESTNPDPIFIGKLTCQAADNISAGISAGVSTMVAVEG